MADRKLEIVLAAKDVTGAAFTKVSTRITNLTKRVFSLQGAFFTLAGGAGLGALVKQSLSVNDALAKTSDRLGLTTEALAGLRHAAELSGAGTKNLDLGLQRMTRRIAEAAQGGGVAASAIEELGLSAQELAALSPDKAFFRIADAMGDVENQSDRVRLAFKLFDSEGVKLINTLDMGSAGLRETAQEASDLGLAISRVDAARIETANDAFYKAQQSVKGLATTVTVALAPGITEAADAFTRFVKQNRELVSLKVTEYIDRIRVALEKIYKIISYDPAIFEWGIVGLAIGGRKGAVIVGGMAHMVEWANNLAKAFENARNGLISFGDIARANFKELEALANAGQPTYHKVPDYISITPGAAAPRHSGRPGGSTGTLPAARIYRVG